MKKRIVVCLATFLILILNSCLVFASSETSNAHILKYQYVERIKVDLTISNGTAKMLTEVKDTNGDTTKLSCTMTLQKYVSGSWTKVSSWDKTTKSNTLTLYKTKAVNKGKYRVKSVVKAHKGNKSETITKYSIVVSL